MRARLLLAMLLLVGGCGRDGSGTPVEVGFSAGSSALRIRAQIADTPAERGRGLMGRRTLAPHAGMLFVFPDRVQVGFYMKDTLIPLDIAFIDAGKVVDVRTMTPCRSTPCPVTYPSSLYSEALEVNAGVFGRAGIGPGAAVTYDRSLPRAS